jgi:PKD repeat protein
VTVTAGDGTYSSSQEFTWTVTQANPTVPTMTNPGTQVDAAGDSVVLPISASDSDGDSLTYTAMGLPDGLTIDPFSGVITGDVASDAVSSTPYAVTVSAADGNGEAASQRFEWIVNDSQVAVQVSPVSVEEGASFALQATFTDTDVVDRQASDYTATVNWGDGNTDTLVSLVDGTTDEPINGSAGQFTISDAHAYLQPGSYPIQVTVKDPAGQSWVGTTTATVSAAPLTVTGGLVDDAVPGVFVTQALASFTDANVADPAGSYTAIIDWGDDTQSAGVISGTDGDFVVSGTHDYAAQGNYPVAVTVTNTADQTKGTGTSTMDVGAIFAGQPATLQVASFTSSNPNATASDFSAEISWGDGTQSAGAVTGSNGQFQVTGSHIYATDGNYAVQVTVTDQYGDTLTTTGAVYVVRDPLAEYGNTVESTAGVSLNNVLLGVFTDPDAGDQSGEYTATINWGDGTAPTVGRVVGSDGLFEVLGSHTYANAGEFVPTVQVEWADPTLAFYLLPSMDVLAAPGAQPSGWGGAKNVPGNSEYDYAFTLPEAPSKPDWKKTAVWSTNSENAKVVAELSFQDPEKNIYGVFARVAFKNVPAQVAITLKLDWGSGEQTKTYEVNVVQVTVTTPPTNAFVPGGMPGQLNAVPGRFSIKDVGTQVPLQAKPVGTSPLEFRRTWDNRVVVAALPRAGLTWKATVTLTGPNVASVNHIQVGFIQHVKSQQEAVLFPTISKELFNTTPAAPDDQGYIDGPFTNPPWYTDNAAGTLNPSRDGKNKTIVAEDSPHGNFPVEYPGTVPATYAKSIEYSTNFTLDVAAMTLDARGSPFNGYWQEAYAVQADGTAGWSFNLSGGIDDPGLKWTPPAVAVKPPTQWKDTVWVDRGDKGANGTGTGLEPVQETVTPQTANQAGAQAQWVPTNLP